LYSAKKIKNVTMR